jgi:DNA repair protein RadA/Sms
MAPSLKKAGKKTVFNCQSCGYRSPQWLGRCPECGEWDSLVEAIQPAARAARSALPLAAGTSQPVAIDAVADEAHARFSTGIAELDQVLGGGIVPGSLILIGGDPGIGKSTLMLQALYGCAQGQPKVLYVSGEESVQQLKMRSNRLKAMAPNLLVVSEIDVDAIVAMAGEQKPTVLVIDSIQTLFSPDLASAPGSISQVREAAVKLMLLAKQTGISIFLVGHVTKDGALAGPRLLEHMVDTVLYFEGDRNHLFRILRAVKNRFGSTNEIGVFEMQEAGLVEVRNPSALFIAERPVNTPGSVVTACMEGTRPILVELQALTCSTSFGNPRRTILGIDANRVALLVAVMEKKLGLHLTGHDIFINVAGGVKLTEPSVDLAIVAAIASSFLDKAIPEGLLIFGEVGLTGEVRPVGQAEARVQEAAKLGFDRCYLPIGNYKQIHKKQGQNLSGVDSVAQAVEAWF